MDASKGSVSVHKHVIYVSGHNEKLTAAFVAGLWLLCYF